MKKPGPNPSHHDDEAPHGGHDVGHGDPTSDPPRPQSEHHRSQSHHTSRPPARNKQHAHA